MTLDPAHWLAPGESITFLRIVSVHDSQSMEFLDGRIAVDVVYDAETGEPQPLFRSDDGHEKMCVASEEGITWIRGCGTEAREALLASRALLRSRGRRIRFSKLTLSADCCATFIEEDS